MIERRSGSSKLVYNKERRTIETVRTKPDKIENVKEELRVTKIKLRDTEERVSDMGRYISELESDLSDTENRMTELHQALVCAANQDGFLDFPKYARDLITATLSDPAEAT